MNYFRNFSTRYIFIAASVICLDLCLKALVINTLEPGGAGIREWGGGLIVIGRIENVRAAGISWANELPLKQIFRFIVEAGLVLSFIHVQRRKTAAIFKAAMAFIALGTISNYLDILLFGHQASSPSYLTLSYLYFFGPFISLSDVLVVVGWFVLLFGAVTQFRSFIQLFRAESPRVNNA